MRKLLWLSLFAVGCAGSQEKTLTGTAPQGAADIYAIDTQGRTAHADATSGAFSVVMEPGAPMVLFVAMDDGSIAPLTFDADAAGTRQSRIPDFTGTIDLGQLSIVDLTTQRDGQGTVEAESEENPLDEIDSDDDGEADREDADDDGDGEEDGDDEDDDGDGEDDDEQDLDSDDDGSPDEADSDDDDDGVEDDEDSDDDGEDADGEDAEDPAE
jgi:hypothetical protein